MLVNLIRSSTVSQLIQLLSTRITPFRNLSTYTSHGSHPVSGPEFRLCIERCKPTKVWPEKIGVAFSGGPDSLALLYLLKELTANQDPTERNPKEIIALTVDHGLQSASSHMTEQCSRLAAFLQVKHMKIAIPWNVPPFPGLPEKDAAFEKIAREARYHVLLEAMVREKISVIAFGHHADDQVETSLLRISRGSSQLGAAGMRPCRRWGMGFGDGQGSLGWAGHHGMNRWIIRPLLEFPKDRLIKSCVANGLNFVQDSTNFQPHLTPRNFIRHALDLGGNNKAAAPVPSSLKESIDILLRLGSHPIDPSSGILVMTHNASGRPLVEQMRFAVRSLSDRSMRIEYQVDNALKEVLKPSPVSTILVSEEDLSAISDNAVRIGMVRRILRYVSPFPWGSPRAEAGGRSVNLHEIVARLCNARELGESTQGGRTKFVAGAGVLWSPIITTSNGDIKYRTSLNPGEKRGWLASRQPPVRTVDLDNKDLPATVIADSAGSKPLELDITPQLASSLLSETRDVVEVLYDCRFLIRIDAHILSSYVSQRHIQPDRGDVGTTSSTRSRLLVVPHTKYFLPKLVLCLSDRGVDEKFEVATLRPDGVVDFPILENNKSRPTQLSSTSSPRTQDAVTIDWIRLLDADVPMRGPRNDSGS